MAVGWNGADPVQDTDATQYELGTEYLVNSDITITHIRIWAGAGEINLTGRTGTIWTTGGAVLGTITLPVDLPTGWSTHALDTPVERTAASRFVVSYGTGGNEGALAHGLDSNVVSADGAVTALGFGNATGTINGRFRVGAGAFPNSGNASHAFYGADIVYDLGIGGNTAPRITSATVVAVDATATAVINAVDDESLVNATYRYDWGDGTTASSTNHPTNTAQHTYTTSGIYPVLLSVTDADGLSAYVARYVVVSVPPTVASGVNARTILDAALSHAATLGAFDRFTRHEPKNAPGQGLSYAMWVDAIEPVAARSGLDTTSVRFTVMARLFQNMLAEPQDEIDPAIMDALDALFAAYTGDFTLGGLIAEVDLLGAYGAGMRAQAGYIRQDSGIYRAVTVTLPLIINNAYEQEP